MGLNFGLNEFKTGILRKRGSRFLFIFALLAVTAGCAVFTTRPAQEMSDTRAAIHAAREVQGDVKAPELFRLANEWFFKAKNEYKYKNFRDAKAYLIKARKYAEEAEFESLKDGAARTEVVAPDPFSNIPPPPPMPEPSFEPYPYPEPKGTPADVYDQRKQEDEQREQQQNQPPNGTPTQPAKPPANLGPIPTP